MGPVLDLGNRTMAFHMVGALDLQPGEHVLEIGFGGGLALRLMHTHEPTARLSGVEPSGPMLRRAQRRMPEGVRLVQGHVEALPFEDHQFDAVCTANTLYFWTELQVALSEIRRVLRPGGRLVLGVNTPERLRAAGLAEARHRVLEPEALVGELKRAGFADVRFRRMPDPGDGTLLFTATRPPDAAKSGRSQETNGNVSERPSNNAKHHS